MTSFGSTPVKLFEFKQFISLLFNCDSYLAENDSLIEPAYGYTQSGFPFTDWQNDLHLILGINHGLFPCS